MNPTPTATKPFPRARHDALETLYEPTRRLSRWLADWLEAPWLSEACRRDVTDWLHAFPDSWWSRFPKDDSPNDTTNEDTHA